MIIYYKEMLYWYIFPNIFKIHAELGPNIMN